MKINNITQHNLSIKNTNKQNYRQINYNQTEPSFKGVTGKVSNELSNGVLAKTKLLYGKLTDTLATGLSKVADTKGFGKITKWLGDPKNEKIGFPLVIAAESIWLSTFYTLSALKNKKVEKKQKETEAIYQTLVAVFCALGAFTIDGLVNNIVKNFQNTFKQVRTDSNIEVIENAIKNINQDNVKKALEPIIENSKKILSNSKDERIIKSAKNTIENAFESALKTATDSADISMVKNAIKKFMKIDKIDNCAKGISKIKTVIIFATIYRFIGPVIMNPIANKISGHFQNKAKANESNKAQPAQVQNK